MQQHRWEPMGMPQRRTQSEQIATVTLGRLGPGGWGRQRLTAQRDTRSQLPLHAQSIWARGTAQGQGTGVTGGDLQLCLRRPRLPVTRSWRWHGACARLAGEASLEAEEKPVRCTGVASC